VERANRSLQRLMYMFMTQNETRTYLPALPSLVAAYNNRPHRSIAHLTPNEAERPENFPTVVSALRAHYFSLVPAKKKPLPYKVGDVVRLKTGFGRKFNRSYEEQFSREQYKIYEVNERMAIPMYFLQSLDTGIKLQGGSYANELSLIKSDIFQVEEVLDRRIRRGVPEIYVKWLDFTNEHNMWIPESNVTRVYNG
jgi:Chromo (CHRromatin Organisation MOdifier) domain